MLKLLAAPNALKGSLTAGAAAAAIASGARAAAAAQQVAAEVTELGIADGGDGTAEVICQARGGVFRSAPALDALGRSNEGRFAWLPDGTAVVDVATASGLAQIAPSERDPLRATSYGTGQLVLAALRAGAQRVLLGVGGSATVDSGAGLLEALGARFLDDQGRPLPAGGAALQGLARIDLSQLEPLARQVPIEIACDVDCPLLGEQGSARMFAPQKGATAAGVLQLEAGLARFADVVERDFARRVRDVVAGGAAGGIAAGLHGVLGARLLPGVDLVLDAVGFDAAARGADLCITAEGSLDQQSLHDKGPVGVARRARALGVPVIALSGGIDPSLTSNDLLAFAGVFSICPRPMRLESAMQEAAELLRAASEQLVRLFLTGRLRSRP